MENLFNDEIDAAAKTFAGGGEMDERIRTFDSGHKQAELDKKFLFEIAEKIRRAENAEDVLFAVACAVGEHLQVRRCLFNEIDLEQDRETVHRDYCRGVESVAGVHRISDYSPVTSADMKAGKTVVNRDSQTDSRTAEFYEQTYAPVGERAYVAVPLMRENRWVASLWVSDDAPRNWSDAEINLLETIGERAWLAVEKLLNEVALRESEERFSKAFDTTPHLITITKLEGGQYLSVNDLVVRATGYTRSEMIGRTADELNIFAEPKGRAKLLDAFQNGVVRDLEIKLRTKNGEIRLLKLSADVINIQDEKCILTTSIDITESKRAEQSLVEQQRLAVLNSDVSLALIQNHSLTEILNSCAETLVKHLDAAFARIWTLNEKENVLELQASAGIYTHLDGEHSRVPVGKYKIGLIAAERKPHLTNSVIGDSRVSNQEWAEREGMVAFAGYPLIVGERLVGVAAVFARHPLGEATLESLASAANTIALGIERNRAEEKIRQSEESYRILAETASDAIIRIDASSTIEFVNTAAERIFGYAPEEMVGQSLTMLMPEEMRQKHRAGFGRYLKTGKRNLNWESIEVPARHKDGHHFPLEISFGEYHHDGKRFFIGIARDITERRQAEKLLRESEERFAKAFNSSPLSITITSLKTGKLIEVNETFVDITGYSREDAIGQTTAELGLWQPSERDAELAVIASEGQISNSEYRFRMKDGSEIVGLLSAELLEIGGEPCALTVIQDITTRKRAEELIRESEEKFRNLANSISQFAWMTDASGFIFWYNNRWFEYTGTTLEEMQGWGWQEVHHPEEVERVTEKFKQHIASGEIWEDTFPLRSKTGEFRWFLSRALPIRDENGNIVRWFGTNTDIEEVRQARLQAETANRLKDEFLATVSHELRTPLNAILGWSSMLQSDKTNDETKARANEIIYRNAKSQAQLIEDLLDVSRIITGKLKLEPHRVEFVSVIKSAVDTIRPAVDAKSIELETNIDGESCVIGGDTQRLQQIVWNLISNAVKFTPEGGKVAIKLENKDTRARLTVSDTGKGIEAEFLPFIFERFRQEDASSTRRHGGLGLGLAIVRHLVELHGGTIAATSAGENLGSIFTVELPLTSAGDKLPDGEARNLRESLSDGFSGANQTKKQMSGVCVLLVDDELDTLLMLDTALTAEGADVRVASSAADAFEILQNWKPDVIISDIAMPIEDGYSLIKKVRELVPGEGGLTPAIAMTAYVRLEDRMRVLASGFQMYVPKPAEPAEIMKAINSLVEKSIVM